MLKGKGGLGPSVRVLTKRVLSALVFIPLIAFLVQAEPLLPLALFVAIVAGAGAFEILRLEGAKTVFFYPCAVGGAFGMALAIGLGEVLVGLGVLLGFVMVGLLAALMGVDRTEETQKMVFAMLYTGFTLPFLVLIKKDFGWEYLAAMWASLWIGDILAFFGGQLTGYHKLIVRVSPAKSWEGTICGLWGTTVAFLLIAKWLGVGMGVGVSIIFGTALALVGIFGDLAESAMKREAGVKESGFLVPGHGGVLDVFDSMIFAAPFAYLFAKVMGIGG